MPDLRDSIVLVLWFPGSDRMVELLAGIKNHNVNSRTIQERMVGLSEVVCATEKSGRADKFERGVLEDSTAPPRCLARCRVDDGQQCRKAHAVCGNRSILARRGG